MIRPIEQAPGRGEQAYQSLLDAICEGTLAPGAHLVQVEIAEKLGVSRQPVQQALAILKSEGLLVERGKRGLFVAPLDVAAMRHHYEIRAALDGLAARRVAERTAAEPRHRDAVARDGASILEAGQRAIRHGQVAEMVRCDVAFHTFLYTASGNPLVAPSAEAHWRQLRRVMGEVLRRAETPSEIWGQHAGILEAVVRSEPARAQTLAIEHVSTASLRLARALASAGEAAPGDAKFPGAAMS